MVCDVEYSVALWVVGEVFLEEVEGGEVVRQETRENI